MIGVASAFTFLLSALFSCSLTHRISPSENHSSFAGVAVEITPDWGRLANTGSDPMEILERTASVDIDFLHSGAPNVTLRFPLLTAFPAPNNHRPVPGVVGRYLQEKSNI
jgi:hypothetical protein